VCEREREREREREEATKQNVVFLSEKNSMETFSRNIMRCEIIVAKGRRNKRAIQKQILSSPYY
jgi:hypothetical protein